MAKFLDGPAAGASLDLRNCPHFLRVTTITDRQPRHGRMVDALDQPSDVVEDYEDVHAYVLVAGTWGQVFVRPGGRYEYGDYRYLPDVPVDELRSRERWVAWLHAHGNEAAVDAGLDPWIAPLTEPEEEDR